MAIKDFPNVNPDANATFGLESNTSEFRSVLSNDVQHMSLPGDRWVGSVSFTNRTRNEANKVKAFKASLGGKSGRFYFTPVDAYQAGTMGGSGVIDGSVASGSSSLPTNGWAADQDTLFEAGDYLEVNGELKMVVDDVAAPQSYIEYTGTNYMPSPFDPEGWYGNIAEPDLSYSPVVEENPSGEFFVGEFEYTGTGAAVLAINPDTPFVIGEMAYSAILLDRRQYQFIRFVYQLRPSNDTLSDLVLNFVTSSVERSAGNPVNYRITDIGENWALVETEYPILDNSDHRVSIWMQSDAGAPNIGENIKVQAAYFGKNPLDFPYAIYNQFEDASEANDWIFNGYNETINNGLLNLVSTNTDPQMLKSVNFDPSVFYLLRVRVRENVDIGSRSQSMSFFFRTASQGYNPSTKTDFNLEGPIDSWVTRTGPDVDGFYTFEIDMRGCPEWPASENITGLRFDFTNASTGTDTDVDYIIFESPELRQEYEGFWPAQLLATANIPIAPPLRRALTGGEAITTTNPRGVFYLGSNSQEWSINVNGVQNMGFDFIEDVN